DDVFFINLHRTTSPHGEVPQRTSAWIAASAFGLLAMTVWWGKRGASLFSEGGQIRVEVAPARVHCLYKLALTAAGAGLDLLFPQDGALHRSVQLVPHQPPATVASAKTFLQTFAVLIGPP